MSDESMGGSEFEACAQDYLRVVETQRSLRRGDIRAWIGREGVVCRLHMLVDICQIGIEFLVAVAQAGGDIIGRVVKSVLRHCAGCLDAHPIVGGSGGDGRRYEAIAGADAELRQHTEFGAQTQRVGRPIILRHKIIGMREAVVAAAGIP